jgi:hypothetical protein
LKENFYIEIINEIFEGYTRFDFKGQAVFLRHFNLRDQKLLNECFEKHRSVALSRGIQDEKDILEGLKKDGTWTDQDELKITELQNYLDSLEKTKSKIVIPSQKQAHQKTIDSEKAKLLELKNERKQLVGKTATEYANNRANEDFLQNLLFRDRLLSSPFFSDSEFEELDDLELALLMQSYYSIIQKYNDEHIQHAVLQDCFSLYLSHCEKPFDFFGAPITKFSIYQLKLIAYGRMFLNIFQNVDKIPDSIKKDPDALISFAESSRNKEKLTSKMKDNSATAVFGATKEDLDFVDPEAKKLSLKDMLAQNGGQLNMEQMMQIMGEKV